MLRSCGDPTDAAVSSFDNTADPMLPRPKRRNGLSGREGNRKEPLVLYTAAAFEKSTFSVVASRMSRSSSTVQPWKVRVNPRPAERTSPGSTSAATNVSRAFPWTCSDQAGPNPGKTSSVLPRSGGLFQRDEIVATKDESFASRAKSR